MFTFGPASRNLGLNGNTLDPAFFDGASFTFEDENLTVNNTTGIDYATAWSLIGKSAGKWYCECLIVTHYNSNTRFGLVDAAGRSASRTILGSAPGLSWSIRSGGFVEHNVGGQVDLRPSAAFTTGNVVGMAIDMATGKVWWSVNNAWVNGGNPAAGTGQQYSSLAGTVYVALNPMASAGSGAKLTVRLGVGHSYSPPSGFSVWA